MNIKRGIEQWVWMVGIWAGSVIALGIVSMGFRFLMTMAGFKS